LEILVCGGDIIGRKQRKAFNRFLEHPDPRIRRYAEELAARDSEARELLKSLEYGDDLESEDDPLEFESSGGSESGGLCSKSETNGIDDDDIPF
jgi:hypothetical protein